MNDTPLEHWADALTASLGPSRVVQVFRQSASTQDLARRLIEARGDEATGGLIVAEHQTAGRGRLGRTWHSPTGACLTFSLILPATPAALERIAFAVSVALSRVLDRWLEPVGTETIIKWPNDIYTDRGKLAGILVEACPCYAVVGVGVNVGLGAEQLSADLCGHATSLQMCGADADRLDVLQAAVEHIEAAVNERDESRLLETWRRKCGMLHRDVRLGHDGQVIEGRVIDVDLRDGLIVRRVSGEIVHLPAATTTVLS
ncbi:MAG: biotin--[acetyl-CoA-carboxylase] ligase [Planctomycetota bacterium]